MSSRTKRPSLPAQAHPPTFSEWAHRRIATVQLEPDFSVLFRVPSLHELLAEPDLENPLRAIVIRFASEAIVEASEFTPEEMQAFLDLRARVIVKNLIEPDLVKEFGSVEAAMPHVIAEMPPVHQDRLWVIAMHGRADAPYLDLANDNQMVAALKVLADLAPFRANGPGGKAVGDGSPNGKSAE